MHDTPIIPCKAITMRKRKRGYGTYVDEDTGEVSTVQTTKQAKRDHQKSGKWYKEPTEQEIRAWEREEKQQAAADREARREENKKLNAAKRAEQEAKDQNLKRQMFEAGKITFTQTLAKKDEDQLNLHSWFGGRPQQSRSRKPLAQTSQHNADKQHEENKEDNGNGRAAHRLTKLIRSLSHESTEDRDMEGDKGFFKDGTTLTSKKDLQPEASTMDQRPDLDQDELDLLNSSQDFDIAEDSDVETEVLDPESEQAEQDSYNVFKVPDLPPPREAKRLPLSPVSQSELNVRATQSLQVSSFKGRLAKAEIITTTSSTQAVRDILSGICTQDLALDLGDEELDKENQEPEDEVSAKQAGSPIKKSSPLKQVETVYTLAPLNRSFTSMNDSFNYDDIFDGLDDPNPNEDADCPEDFDDCGLDDAFLSALPLTQMVSSARSSTTTPFPTATPKPAPFSGLTKMSKSSKEPFKKYDSFASEGLDDDDLVEGLKEFERSQNKAMTPATVVKRRGALPWEKQGWAAETTTTAALEQLMGDIEDDGTPSTRD